MSNKLRRYKKDTPYSYTFGVFPSIELLTHRPEQCTRVLVRSNAERNTGVAKLQQLCDRHDVRIELADKALERIGAPDNAYAVGVFNKYEQELDKETTHVLLDGPRDMGNLGSIMRTMLAFDIRDLAIIRPAAHVFDPKAVRASMGALFQMRVTYWDSFEDYRATYERNYYPFIVDAPTELRDTPVTDAPVTLIFGSESNGLDPSFAGVGTPLRIKQSDAIDSLNLASSVAIALYAFAGR